jgi:hypothetical protein
MPLILGALGSSSHRVCIATERAATGFLCFELWALDEGLEVGLDQRFPSGVAASAEPFFNVLSRNDQGTIRPGEETNAILYAPASLTGAALVARQCGDFVKT